jgi:hypothetical protein
MNVSRGVNLELFEGIIGMGVLDKAQRPRESHKLANEMVPGI